MAVLLLLGLSACVDDVVAPTVDGFPPSTLMGGVAFSLVGGMEVPIATGPSGQWNPVISGDWVVWEDDRNGNVDIYAYNLSTSNETRLTTDPGLQVRPAISGNRVVWMDDRNGNFDIYSFDLSSAVETRVTTDPGDQTDPAISGNWVVWTDEGQYPSQVYSYDLNTGIAARVTTPAGAQRPAISGSIVVWMDNRHVGNDIYAYDLSLGVETRLTVDADLASEPAISGDHVVWMDNKNGNYDIYRYDLSAGAKKRLTTDLGEQILPAISGNWVVWVDYRNGAPDIYAWDLVTGTESRLTIDPAGQFVPAIWGDRVVWMDDRNGNYDIYAWLPGTPPPLVAGQSIAAGYDFSCAIRSDGAISCWGNNNLGQATPPAGSDFVQLSAGADFACALRASGSVNCWGNGISGQTTPPASPGFVHVAAGSGHACGVQDDGAVACWGSGVFGQTSSPAGTDYVQVTAGEAHSCALRSAGSIACWGYDDRGQATPPAGATYIQVTAGGKHTCALDRDGTIDCWGGLVASTVNPPAGSDFVQLNAGLLHSCAVRSGGTVACWGVSADGRTNAPAGIDFVEVAAGGKHSCARKGDDTYHCWGDNTSGQTEPPPLVPTLKVEFPGLDGVKVEVRNSDGQPGTVGSGVLTLTNQSDVATAPVSAGVYDIRVTRGAQKLVVDDVTCNSGLCIVADLVASLTVDVGALANVKIEARDDDGAAGTVGGGVLTLTNQSGVVALAVLKGSYDVRLTRGAQQLILDAVDCSTSGPCAVSGVVQTLNVDLGPLTGIKVEARDDDGAQGTVGGGVQTLTNQGGVVMIPVLTGSYDVRLTDGAQQFIIDAVDCSAGGPCVVGNVESILNVDLGTLAGVKIEVRTMDGTAGTVGGGVQTLTNQSGLVTVPVLMGRYDVRLTAGAQQLIIDALYCLTNGCAVSDVTTTLSVDLAPVFGYPDVDAITGVKIEIREADGVVGTVGGGVTTLTNQQGMVVTEVLKGAYDVRLTKGAQQFVADGLDCLSGPCDAGVVLDLLELYTDPAIENLRVDIRESDGAVGTVGGGVQTFQDSPSEASYWIPVLRGSYDLRFRQGAQQSIADDVACSLVGTCVLNPDAISSVIVVELGSLTGVRIEIRGSDGLPGTVGGGVITRTNQSGQVTIPLILGIYDVRLTRNGEQVVLDDVDCSNGAGVCTVDASSLFPPG